MRCSTIPLVCLTFALVWQAPASALSTPITPAQRERAEQLIRQLGDRSFLAREQASYELARMGLAIKDLLVEASQGSDLEIRRRCQELLPRLLQADRKVRLEAFSADREGKEDHGLPGWKHFRQLAGNDEDARKLFIQIQKSDSARFLQDIEEAPERVGEIAWARCQELQQNLYGVAIAGGGGIIVSSGRGRTLDLTSIASLVAVLSDPEIRLPNTSAVYTVSNFLLQASSRAGVASSPAYKRLVLAWMRTYADQALYAQQVLNIAQNLGLPEGQKMVFDALAAHKIEGQQLGYLLANVGRLNKKEHLSLFESYLTDKTVVATPRVGTEAGTTQVRDIALGMLVNLTGQSHKDYGFFYTKRFKDRRLSSTSYRYNYYYLGFGNDKERDEAFKKWQAWKAKNKKTAKK
jgi:hypothetical protein